jgi:hypothetical protein
VLSRTVDSDDVSIFSFHLMTRKNPVN